MTTSKLDTFLDVPRIRDLSALPEPRDRELDEILYRARVLQGITIDEAARLLAVEEAPRVRKLLKTAAWVKEQIYGKRMVLFAPLYTGNYCVNNCTYCGFRRENRSIPRILLSQEEIERETVNILRQGHKRVLLLCGESGLQPLDYTLESIKTCYDASWRGQSVRRINVEIAPLTVDEFKELKTAGIGTYTCFQETYDPELYSAYHLSGPKADYSNRLYVMDRAMEAGLDDVGIGALFGLGDYKFEVLSLLAHAAHLEESRGCGPHTVSVPRIEPAPGAPDALAVPRAVPDEAFKKLIAVLRIALPYTGIILSTRESETLRREIFHYGVSQVSAGSRTNPGGYSRSEREEEVSQFELGDRRSLEEVISGLIDDGFVPSFCTGCYRKGRVGNDFMDLAKPGLIKKFCLPNGLVSFAEYLIDFAGEPTRRKGFRLIEKIAAEAPEAVRPVLREALERTRQGERDIYL